MQEPRQTSRAYGPGPRRCPDLLRRWLAMQAVNLRRHTESLRPFSFDEFGNGPAAPSRGHIDAVNRFIGEFRARLRNASAVVDAAAAQAGQSPTQANLQRLLSAKEDASRRVLYVEGIWDFYFDLFVQRLSAFGERLRAIDRIAANCYEDLYLGLGTARPLPTLLPFSYASSGFSPLTYRRNVPLQRLRHHPNLFPLVVIPQHRLDAVWALSSVLHEVSHNLQADLGLWQVMPKFIFERLTADGGLEPKVAQVWGRWHKEIAADLFALLLGGPATVESLMDVVGRSRRATVRYLSGGVHPTPVLRVPINLVLLRRLGFPKRAAEISAAWKCLYPRFSASEVPPAISRTFDRAAELTVDTIVFTPRPQLAGKSLAELVEFGPSQMALLEQAADRLGRGEDVGSVPPRLMVSAARRALELKLASPQEITDNFYRTLGRR
ncbi:MAG TPA: hypothetical protein VEJ84_03315 [Acidimicrobiales bacterium]|nr:hypothetical protein [Acidimicrobiales bacterium]